MDKGLFNTVKINRKRLQGRNNDRFSEYSRRFWERKTKRERMIKNGKGEK